MTNTPKSTVELADSRGRSEECHSDNVTREAQ